MSQAARVSDPHTCPMMAPIPHVGGVIQPPGAATVLIGDLPAAVVGSSCTCGAPLPNLILNGSSTVLIDHRGAARVGDPTGHGGTIVTGCSTVLIG